LLPGEKRGEAPAKWGQSPGLWLTPWEGSIVRDAEPTGIRSSLSGRKLPDEAWNRRPVDADNPSNSRSALVGIPAAA